MIAVVVTILGILFLILKKGKTEIECETIVFPKLKKICFAALTKNITSCKEFKGNLQMWIRRELINDIGEMGGIITGWVSVDEPFVTLNELAKKYQFDAEWETSCNPFKNKRR